MRAYASQLQNGWSGDRHPARKSDDYAKEAKIAVDKGFDAIKMNFLTFKEDEGRYPITEQTAFLNSQHMKTSEARIAATREAMVQM